MLIRDIREHNERSNAKNTTSGATTKSAASERRRSSSVKRGPPNRDEVEWMSVEHPGGTGSDAFSKGLSVGPAAMARAQELLGRMPPEDLQKLLAGVLGGKQG